MKIAIAQINPTVGDLHGNSQLIRGAAEKALASGAELLVVSELAICGYPPRDLLHRGGFVDACLEAISSLAKITTDQFAILVGHPARHPTNPNLIGNGASLLHQGQVVQSVLKTLLPNYDVFDEKRYFVPGPPPSPIEYRGLKLGVHICEDAWWGEQETFYHYFPQATPDPVATLAAQGVDLFVNLSASPYESGKIARRHQLIRKHVSRHQRPFLFVNQVGGNDDLVFDGNSFAMNAQGELTLLAKGFDSDLQIFDTAQSLAPCSFEEPRREVQLLDALTLGLRDYMRKCGFSDAVLGLSGGIDSALAAVIAARAIGPERVHTIMMPSRYSSEHSIADSVTLAENLGIDAITIPIDEVHRVYESLPTISEDLSSQPGGLTDQNLQARVRGAIVMTRSNRHHWLALTTGNKSELAVGYCTLYGDMCGGFAVLSDLYKQDVYGLCEEVNRQAGKAVIPENIIEKAPSAELAPNQFDQDSLPPYPVLDAILKGLIDEQKSPAELIRFFPEETVRWVVTRLDRNEFKRRQMPPGVKLNYRAFGTGRRMPMAARVFTGLDPISS